MLTLSGTIFLSAHSPFAQNLVPNPGFETFTTCPTNPGGPGNMACPPWISLNSADYFNVCAANMIVNVPYNFPGYQWAFNGDAYAGSYFRLWGSEYREYIQVQLTEPLQAGFCYEVAFWINLGNECCATNSVGAYLSVNAPTQPGQQHIDVDPQITGSSNFYSDTVNWVQISGSFVASGGEEYITIGNFSSDAECSFPPNCNPNGAFAYYYFDNVSVISNGPAQMLDLDLGPPVIECDAYEIDPGISGVSYTWSNGSHAPSLLVHQSGTYALTITGYCSFAVDSVEVTILGADDVQINPGVVQLCEGETFTVSLDPAAGTYTWNDGSHNANYTISTPGVFTVTLDDGCDLSSDFIEVNVVSPPDPPDLGQDTFLCMNTQILLSLDPDQGIFHWQDNSQNPFFLVTAPGNYSVTITNDCGSSSGTLQVENLPPPVVELGNDVLYLCPLDEIEYMLDPAMGVYTWNTGDVSPVYLITEPGMYAVTVSNACGEDADQVMVVEPGVPQVELGGPYSVCADMTPLALVVNGLTEAEFVDWSTGSVSDTLFVSTSGTYAVTVFNACYSETDVVDVLVVPGSPVPDLGDTISLCENDTITFDLQYLMAPVIWQDGSTQTQYEITNTGTYFVTAANICGTGSDTVEIVPAVSFPEPDLGPDFSLCPGEQVTLQLSLPGIQFLWQDGSSLDSFVVTTAGTYAVTTTDGCTTYRDSVIVTSNSEPPQLTLPQNVNLCQGAVIDLESGITGVNYTWSDGSTGSSLSVSGPGTYILTVANACGTDTDSTIVIDGGPPPLVDLGPDLDLCPGNILDLTPIFSDVTTWSWNTGEMVPEISVNNPGIYSVAASNSCGAAFDTLIVTLLPPTPVPDLGPDTALCPDIHLVLTIPFSGVSVLWQDGSTASSYAVSAAGIYAVTVSDVCGLATDSLVVSALPPAPLLNLGMDQSLCPGEMITLDPELVGVSYLWQDGSTLPVYIVSQPGTIILEVMNSCGSSTDTLIVAESTEGPQVNLGPDVLACEGDTVKLMSDIFGVSYLWQNGSTSSSLFVTQSGTYILQVSNLCGIDADTIDVDIHGIPPVVELGPDTVLCAGNTLLLESNADSEAFVLWQDSSTGPTFLVRVAGLYSLVVQNRCGENADTIDVEFTDPPVDFSLGNDTILCPGQAVVLTAPDTEYDLLWQDGSTGTTMQADREQVYWLEVSNQCGTSRDEFILTIDQQSPVFAIDPVTNICPGETVVLDAEQSFPALYSWSTGASTPSIQVVNPGTFSVTVSSLCNSGEASSVVLPSADCDDGPDFYLPNMISPNGDQINDEFFLTSDHHADIVSMDARIYDRWGNLVFHTNTMPVSWAGDVNGRPLNPGVFTYLIRVGYVDHGEAREKILHGDLTIIR